jgi:hypothetical protein
MRVLMSGTEGGPPDAEEGKREEKREVAGAAEAGVGADGGTAEVGEFRKEEGSKEFSVEGLGRAEETEGRAPKSPKGEAPGIDGWAENGDASGSAGKKFEGEGRSSVDCSNGSCCSCSSCSSFPLSTLNSPSSASRAAMSGPPSV